jgi:hypothetical protein
VRWLLRGSRGTKIHKTQKTWKETGKINGEAQVKAERTTWRGNTKRERDTGRGRYREQRRRDRGDILYVEIIRGAATKREQ